MIKKPHERFLRVRIGSVFRGPEPGRGSITHVFTKRFARKVIIFKSKK